VASSPGAGFGASFSRALRIIAPLAEAHQRTELFAAVYVMSYLSFGLPVVIAGLLVSTVGIRSTTVVYGGAAIMAASVGLIWQPSLGRHEGKRSNSRLNAPHPKRSRLTQRCRRRSAVLVHRLSRLALILWDYATEAFPFVTGACD
jgi:hypothetical protein